MDKLILQVYVRPSEKGPQILFHWPTGAREGLERFDLIASLGEVLAAFGEQLKLEGLGVTKLGPANLYGPDGSPVA